MTETNTLPDTPCFIVDISTVERNIARFQTAAHAAGLAARPHIKTHKLPMIAQMQLDAGAVGITCQKIGEAEVMADAGIRDILITYNIIGAEKLARLVALARRTNLAVTCDSAVVAQGLSTAFAAAGETLPVLIECDTGAARCGVQTPEAAAELASVIAALPGLQFAGLMSYPPMAGADGVDVWLTRAIDLIGEQGMKCERVSTGGTPNMDTIQAFHHATEHRAGTYIYNDRSLITAGKCTVDDCAAVVHATVVSRPTPTRAILDSGSKTLSSDLLGMEGYGLIREAPEAQIVGLSEEHATVRLAENGWQPKVGDRVTIIPNHVCVVTNLFSSLYVRFPDGRLQEMDIPARGKLR